MLFQTPQKLNEVLDFSRDGKNQIIFGLNIGEKSFFAGLYDKQAVIVVSDFISASAYKTQLISMGKRVEIVSGGIESPVFVYSQDLSQIKKTIVSVSKFFENELDFLIVLPEALTQRFSNLPFFKSVKVSKNEELNIEQMQKQLLKMGYTRQNIVTAQGEFAVRGDIFDIFVCESENPVRVDCFDTKIEKIYTFALEDMSKIADIDSFKIYPNTIFFRDEPYKLIDEIQDYQKSLNLKGEQKLKVDQIIDSVVFNIERNENNLNLAYTVCFDKNLNDNILSLFSDKTIFIDEPKKIVQMLDLLYSGFANNVLGYISEGLLLPVHYDYYFPKEKVFCKNAVAVTFSSIHSNVQIYTPQKATTFTCFAPTKYLLNYKSLIGDIKQFLLSKQKVVLYAGDKFSKEKISSYLYENAIDVKDENLVNQVNDGVFVLSDELAYSVMIAETNKMLIATGDIVKKQSKVLVGKKKSVFYLPKVGEYVVHDFHGIGKCVAVERLRLSNFEKDYFVLEYSGGDKIYIPTEQADSISAYLGAEQSPHLNKLGGLEFAKVKERAKKAIEELAVNLIELYKKRENSKGFVFENDSYLQQAFEDSFEYEETTDQMQAIFDAKHDMMSSKIMDRLICGDVGYGKTEVALRCAYKAILSGKQVAILCPTTILSEQHYNTCKKRFKDFMVRAGVLNRLVSSSEQKRTLKQLENGEIDIIIGTHRLLAKDVVFHDLGLLILDEEQRFGVQDKEKIKEIKKNIDVLTLSATPIPRTLHMSLSGIRDISIIETAPKNRLPVQTLVCEYDDMIIETAIGRELSRNGQVFIVYNRVESIFDFKRHIQEIFPHASIGVAHGQMDRKTLEDSVMKLYRGDYQILIATTLIENGIDIPSANTLIVVEADRLGLSSLYQLKGRVGRSNKIAYAYFTYQKNKVLTPDAFSRLSAISEFSSLGSGFKIAMRDLEIRGAGSVLGNRQHGHIEKVGYDLYCRLLEEILDNLKGKKHKEKRDIKIDINISAFIPAEYIGDENERIKFYTSVSMINNIEEYRAVAQTLVSAYGELPQEVVNLLNIALIKNICQEHDVKAVVVSKDKCQIQLYKKEEIIDEFLAGCLEKHSGVSVLKLDVLPIIDFDLVSKDVIKKTEYVLNFLTNS